MIHTLLHIKAILQLKHGHANTGIFTRLPRIHFLLAILLDLLGPEFGASSVAAL